MSKILGILLFLALAVSAAQLVYQAPAIEAGKITANAQTAPLMYAGIRG